MSAGNTTIVLSGARFANRYRVDGVIGQGGMATVYRVFDEQEQVQRAAKVLNPDLAAVVGEQRFAREVMILSKLRHERIVPILDSGVHDGLPFFVMPLFNESLEARLHRVQQFGVREAVVIIQQVAEGVAAAHREGFIHRDLKPANILFEGDAARVADFGIARAVEGAGADTLTGTGVVVGTAKYMSPEQGAGQKVDELSDVYSLACVLYELLAGVPPFSGPTQTVLARHALETPAPLRPFRPSVTPALDNEIQRALAKVPRDRHPSIDAFAQAIGVAVDDTSAGHASDATGAHTVRSRSLRWMAAAAAVLTLGGAAAWWSTRAKPDGLDDNRIVVFPLATPVNRGVQAGVGEDVATVIGNAFGRTEPLRWVDGWSALPPNLRSQPGDVTPAQLRDAARSRRARYMLTGRLTPNGDSMAVVLELTDVRGDSLVAERTENGGRAEPWRQALRAANALLPSLIPGTTRDIRADWLNRPPSAIAAFLLGEAAFRRTQTAEALGHYRRALADDSTFATAAFRGAQAASWEHEPARGIALLDSVRGTTLSTRDLAFAAGLRGYLAGDADSAARSFRRAVTIDPEFAEAWTQLGETYIHLLPNDGANDARADSAFAAARRIDPGAASTLLHPIELRLRALDVAGATPLIDAYERAKPDTLLVQRVRLMRECVSEPDRTNWTKPAQQSPLPLLVAALSLAAAEAPPACSGRMLSTLLTVDTALTNEADNRRYYALAGRINLAVVAGDGGAMIREIDEFVARWKFGTSLFLLYAPLVPSFEPKARDLLRTDAARAGAEWREMSSTVRLWALGGTAVHAGERVLATAAERELRRRADSSQTLRDRLMARSIEARLGLSSADSAGAVATLTSLLRTAVPLDQLQWDEALSLAPERILLARTHLARREWTLAEMVASTVHSAWPAFMPAYRAMALDVMIRAAEGRGDRARVQSLRNRLSTLQDAARKALR